MVGAGLVIEVRCGVVRQINPQCLSPARSDPFGPSLLKILKKELEYDPSAYVMYHCLAPEWPCLSFDILGDTLGGGRTRCVYILVYA